MRESMKVQYWLVELDAHGNPALVDGAHSSPEGANRAAYLIRGLGLGNTNRKFAVAKIELSEVRPNSQGVDQAAMQQVSSVIRPWTKYLDIFSRSQREIWVRWCGVDGIYRWLHPETRTWIEEPNQIDMAMFQDYASARRAANQSPEPPTWKEFIEREATVNPDRQI